jgi:hypothetical protein
MSRKRPDRTERRARMRDARQLVRDRERLAELEPGGRANHPIPVASAALVERRARSLPCAQCAGEYEVRDHRSGGPGLRAVDVRCRQCSVPRTLWFRIVEDAPN